ncbi:hypothetical protein SMICM304S_10917 [Streptomyces microflavus]
MSALPAPSTTAGHPEAARTAACARLAAVDGDIPAGRGAVDVLIRPESIGVTADPEGIATVVSASFLGSVTRVLLDLPDGVAAKADLPSRDATELAPGVRVRVTPVRRPVLVVPVRETTAAPWKPPPPATRWTREDLRPRRRPLRHGRHPRRHRGALVGDRP